MVRFVNRGVKALVLVIALVMISGACGGPDEGPSAVDPPTVEAKPGPNSAALFDSSAKKLAAELKGTGHWINSEPLTLASQRGKVVLIDFWTYSCVNCIRTLPHLKKWDEKYRDKGLVILGVHTPEFRFEENVENLEKAVADEGITWAVVQDNERETWDAYNNSFWPSKYLIDQHGEMRYFYGGEGGYDLTEWRIRELLEETGADLLDVEGRTASEESFPPVFDPSFDASIESGATLTLKDTGDLAEALDPTFKDLKDADVTSELYLGYENGCRTRSFSNSKIANALYCQSKDLLADYQDSGDRQDHRLYLRGAWLAGRESLRHGRETGDLSGYLLLRFASKSVNIVAGSEGGPMKVLVTLDGEPLNESNRGEDVILEGDGRSYLLVDGPRHYNALNLPAYGVHDLKLSPDAKGFVGYSFTFGVYAEGP